MKSSLFLILSLSLTMSTAMAFTPPSRQEALRAIGNVTDLPMPLKEALNPQDDFETIRQPQRGDWLAEHFEPGQSFADFVSLGPSRPSGHRNKIYLQPLGSFSEARGPSLETLRAFTTSFFMMDSKIFPVLPITGSELTTRRNPYTGNRQIWTRDILALLRKRRPLDAFCVLGITMEDLYPDPSWNFVFGQASPREGVGVFSFARYDPAFYGEKRKENLGALLLRRSCKVLAHETGHMFSLAHCIYFRCLMNGSNHLKESDARPLSLCPVCLHKLQFSIGFDVVARYQKLLGFYKRVGFQEEAAWVSRRLKHILE